MLYPIYNNSVINSCVTYHPYISASQATKFYLYDKSITMKKMVTLKTGGGIFVYEDPTPVSNLSASLVKQTFTTTTSSLHSSIKNLCKIYETYSYDYHYYDQYTTFALLQISNMVFGSTIIKGSFTMDDNTGAKRYTDNGRGSLLKSGVRVGKIFYDQGLFLITASADVTSWVSSTNYGVQFSGSVVMPSVMINLNIPKNMAICSTNPSYYVTSSAGQRVRMLDKQEVFFSTIYLYDKLRNLVGIAKLNQPIKKSIQDSYIVRLKYNY